MPKQLTAQTATITTATVEVKTLTISGKQVTLAVFRQLIEEPLIGEDGTLKGTPWGVINHCPEKKYWDTDAYKLQDCATGPTHLHVVWQKGDELRRSRVTPLNTWGTSFCPEWADTVSQGAYCINNHQLPDGMRRVYRDGAQEVVFQHDGMTCWSGYPESPTRNGHECVDAADLEVANAELSTEIAAERERRERHKAQWKAINALPQLFIAV